MICGGRRKGGRWCELPTAQEAYQVNEKQLREIEHMLKQFSCPCSRFGGDAVIAALREAWAERDALEAIIDRARQRVQDEEERKDKAPSYYSVVEQLSVGEQIAESERDEARAEVERLETIIEAEIERYAAMEMYGLSEGLKERLRR
jgi:hypothetical protein